MGKTMFEGDIGSGKSTILMAIEFAFFGLGSETGGSLLKVGETEGSVRMEFEVDGKEYEITRGLLRRGQRVHQTHGRIRMPEGELQLSPSELKEKMLEILTFNEAPDPKAQSRIYRYAVYTPQEDMKSILAMAPDDRLQILRRAFGVEDYRIAVHNSENLVREMKARIRELKARGAEAETLRSRVKVEAESLGAEKDALNRAQAGEAKASEELAALRTERSKLREAEIRSVSISSEVSAQARAVLQLKEELQSLTEEEGRTVERLGKLEEEMSGVSLGGPEESVEELEAELSELDERSNRLAILKDRAEQKLGEYRTIVDRGVCPVCERPALVHEFSSKENTKKTEIAHIDTETSECRRLLKKTKEMLEKRRGHDRDQTKLTLLTGEAEEARRRIQRTGDRMKKLNEGVTAAETRLRTARRDFESLEGLPEKLERLEEVQTRAERVLDVLRIRAADARRGVEEKEKALAEFRLRLVKAAAAEERARQLSEHQVWLEGYFVPTLGDIERTVLATMKQDFDSNFRKWFSMLVGDGQKEAWVDETFTPVVSEDGYEQDTAYLSGGERTSVALAYRLALNTLVQRVSVGMKSNIIILDEPTDGFSKEQLGSVREILDEIACPQIIVVSHEKELESFADQVFRVTKTNGRSVVSASA